MKVKHLLFLPLIFSFFSVHAQDSLDNGFSFKWDKGFKLESQDKNFKLKFGGRLMYDYSFINQNTQLDENAGSIENRSNGELRRMRIYISGEVFNNMLFKVDADISNTEVALKDAYIGFSEIPVIGTLLLGRFKEPTSLSTLTSSNYSTFMEGPDNQNFGPVRNTGIIVFNEFFNNRMGVQLAIFKNGGHQEHIKVNNNGYAVDTRITGLPIHKPEEKELLHFGISYSYRKPKTKIYQISPRLPANLLPKYINTGDIESIDNVQSVNFETFYFRGPLSVQGEYFTSRLKTSANSLNYTNYYGQVSYFLTGENRTYKNSYNPFDRVDPKKNFMGKEKAWGAWEIAMRYSLTELDSREVFGGKQNAFSLGLNWYLNPISRIMVDQTWADIENMGKVRITQIRLQILF